MKNETIISFNNIILLSILFIFLTNTYFSYNLSLFETQSITEFTNFKSSFTSLAKDYQRYQDKISNVMDRINKINGTIQDHRDKIDSFKKSSRDFELLLRKFSNEDTLKMLSVKEVFF